VAPVMPWVNTRVCLFTKIDIFQFVRRQERN
jgi:hypothetical protein